MSENVDINLTTYNRAQFTKAVNTSFTEFGVTGEPEPSIVSQVDINTFFEAYDALFLEIPKQGGTQSHQYLANRSGEYAGGEDINAEIEALTAEVTDLREDNIALQQQIVQITTKTAADALSALNNINTGS
jgi:phenylacetate-coenzyme A ligase PaaK-like adenylate-forming protein